MKPPTLSDMTAFLQIAEHRNFRKAAVALGVSPSALSHTMRNLEARLGTRLLHRTTRSVALTDAGSRLASRLQPALASIDEALSELADDRAVLTGRIRITTMEYGARLLIADVIGDFQALHPDVQVEIRVDHAMADLIADGFDFGVRLREQIPPDMVAIPIGPPVAMTVCASPSYLEGVRLPQQPGDLPSLRCIRQRLATGAIFHWSLERDGRVVTIEPRGSFTCNNLSVIVAAALRGQGVCYVPSNHVRSHLKAGELVQLLADYSPPFDGHCLYYPATPYKTRTLAAFVEHVRAHLHPALAGAASASADARSKTGAVDQPDGLKSKAPTP